VSIIELGIGLSRIDDVAASAQHAESLGYDFVSTGEHVFFYGAVGNGIISLAAAAGATTRIKLMSTITLVPLYPAALLAKLVASLDVVSKGRFNLGVGVGGEFAKEFEACGVPLKERGSRTNESLEVLTQLFSQDDVHFDGRYTQLPGVPLEPKPIQKPLPIWISGRSDAAMKRCARFGTGWLPYMYTPEKLHGSLTKINTMATEFERTSAVKPGLFIFFAIHEDRQTAIDMAISRLSKQYNQDFTKLVHKYAIAGNPDDCIARLRQYIDAGAQTIILNSACPTAHTGENERLMAQIIPAIRGGHR